MDHKIELKFREVVKDLEEKFGEGLDVDSILLLIGVQELGQGYRKFSKDEKMNLMHIAICTILEPWGIYRFEKNDEDGWPHFEKIQSIPAINSRQQEHLMKEAIINYFVTNGLVKLSEDN
ncbi:MAG: hypothetical protein MI810_24515 [Flavobacteriales bacterium]|nr:hypothetical protein [Flavobacteriales bacterium]